MFGCHSMAPKTWCHFAMIICEGAPYRVKLVDQKGPGAFLGENLHAMWFTTIVT